MHRLVFIFVGLLSLEAFAEHATIQLVSRRGRSGGYSQAPRPLTTAPAPKEENEPRWLIAGEQKFFQYQNQFGDWMTAKKYVSIPEGSEETLEVKNKEGKTLTVTAGYTAFLDPRYGWFVWPSPKKEEKWVEDKEEGLFAKMVQAVRKKLKRDPRLDFAARERAKQLAGRPQDFSHGVHPGLMSNFAVRNSGFPLSPGQGDGANSTESIAMGFGTATQTWKQWVTDEGPNGGHHKHIMGTGFSGSHDSYGIGRYGNYWVYLSADNVE